MDELIYMIALKQVKGIGDRGINELVRKLGTPSRVFRASSEEIRKVGGLKKDTYHNIRSFEDWGKAEHEILKAGNMGYRLISFLDGEYPENLLNIYSPPPLLYMNGQFLERDNNSIAIVGARLCDHYGRKITRKIAGGLADHGITITSGMAIGVDSVSHRTSLERGSRTTAVLGNGLDIVYPGENRDLYSSIPSKGCVISEFPLGTSPESGNFPRRNRIISGISLGVVVIQASEKSGSLITASFASEQNREVFAVPGNIDSRLSAGTNKLLKNGAKLVENADDVIEEIVHLSGLNKRQNTCSTHGNISLDVLSREERKICELLRSGKLHVDEIAKKLNIDSSELLSVLLDLELKDVIEQTPGKYFHLSAGLV